MIQQEPSQVLGLVHIMVGQGFQKTIINSWKMGKN